MGNNARIVITNNRRGNHTDTLVDCQCTTCGSKWSSISNDTWFYRYCPSCGEPFTRMSREDLLDSKIDKS